MGMRRVYRALRDQVDTEVPVLDFRMCSEVLDTILMVAVLLWLLASILSENALNNPGEPVKMDLSCPRKVCPLQIWIDRCVTGQVVVYRKKMYFQWKR